MSFGVTGIGYETTNFCNTGDVWGADLIWGEGSGVFAGKQCGGESPAKENDPRGDKVAMRQDVVCRIAFRVNEELFTSLQDSSFRVDPGGGVNPSDKIQDSG